MSCPICDQKPMNCDCTPRERAMWLELQELEGRPAIVLTDAEREAIDEAAEWYGGVEDDQRCQLVAATLRGLLERME
jgi:hypothetical protein